MYSPYLHAIGIVCRSIRSNNGSNQTITAGLRFLALIAFYAPGRINSSIDHLGSGSVHVSGPVAATFPSIGLERSRSAADASREVVERWFFDGLDISVDHRRCPP